LGVALLLGEVFEGQVDAFDLAEPVLGLGAGPTLEQVGLDDVEAGQCVGLDLQPGAAQAGLTEMISMSFSGVWVDGGDRG
jgi:hypothetical protein